MRAPDRGRPRRAPAAAERRRTVHARLAEHGLPAAPRHAWAETDGGGWGRRFGEAVRGLGPGFVLFARYLADRPDLVPVDDALALAQLGAADVAAVLPPAAAAGDPAARIAAELGRPAAEVFADLDPEPVRRDLLHEEHRARLRGGGHSGWPGGRQGERQGGRDVRVRLARPGLDEALAADLPALADLRPAFAGLGAGPFERGPFGRGPFDALLADFRAVLAARLDLRSEALALRRLAEELADPDLLVVPESFPELARPGLAVREELGGCRLDEEEAGAGGERMGGERTGAEHTVSGQRPRELARLLHLAWLEQALVAGHALLDGEWVELADGRLALAGGRCERLAAASRPRLWSYLRHLAAHRPEDAWAAVAGELRAVRRGADERAMRLKLRQLVPFRDGGWSERRDTLAELLALHWRLAREQGFAPSPALAALWAGLYQAALHGRRLDPEGDPLRAALEDLRWLAGFRRLRQLADPGGMGDALEANLTGLLEVPQKLDRLLHLVAGDPGGDLRLRLRVAANADAERRRWALTSAVCLAALMAAVALVAARLPALGVPAAWAEPAAAAVFLGLGALLLRTLTRRRTKQRRG